MSNSVWHIPGSFKTDIVSNIKPYIKQRFNHQQQWKFTSFQLAPSNNVSISSIKQRFNQLHQTTFFFRYISLFLIPTHHFNWLHTYIKKRFSLISTQYNNVTFKHTFHSLRCLVCSFRQRFSLLDVWYAASGNVSLS